MIQVSFYTMGCKLNQLETESLADAFKKEGFKLLPWNAAENALSGEPRILIINTCTVTSHSEQKARHEIRKALRENSGGCILVTGCYAQMEADAIRSLDEKRVFIISGEKKDFLLDLPALIKNISADDLPSAIGEWLALNKDTKGDPFRFRPTDYSFHSRAFVKIQDGCDNSCSFCRVSIARGKSVSRNPDELLADINLLEEKGYREAVLTGVNISQYKWNSPDGRKNDLAGLLQRLLTGTGEIRFRLGSLESNVFTDDFMQIAANPRIRPHFHLSVQSGSPQVLERMGRKGSLQLFEKAVTGLRRIKDDPFIACDIIAGLSGESEDDFNLSLDFCKKSDFAWIHAFPFSRRPGTAAWDFKETVFESEIRRRVTLLNDLAHDGKKKYTQRRLGKETEFIPDTANGKSEKEYLSGVSENYLKLIFPGEKKSLPQGKIYRCKLIRESGGADAKRFDAEASVINN